MKGLTCEEGKRVYVEVIEGKMDQRMTSVQE